MPAVTQPAHKKGDFFIDYEEKVFEDGKAEPGEKALVTFHTVAFGGSTAETVAGVLLYRVVSFWLVLPMGWTAWAGLTVQARRHPLGADAGAAGPAPNGDSRLRRRQHGPAPAQAAHAALEALQARRGVPAAHQGTPGGHS